MIRPTDWAEEAKGVVSDLHDHVTEINISTAKTKTDGIYLNLKTLEKKSFCVELTSAGFRVAGSAYDNTDNPSDVYFETPYAFLESVSDKFKHSFFNELKKKLEAISDINDE